MALLPSKIHALAPSLQTLTAVQLAGLPPTPGPGLQYINPLQTTSTLDLTTGALQELKAAQAAGGFSVAAIPTAPTELQELQGAIPAFLAFASAIPSGGTSLVGLAARTALSKEAPLAPLNIVGRLPVRRTMGIFDAPPVGVDPTFDPFANFSFSSLLQPLTTLGVSAIQASLGGSPAPPMLGASLAGAVPQRVITGAVSGIAGMGGMLVAKDAIKAILQKIAINKGLSAVPSLQRIMAVVRRATPILGWVVVAQGLGIAVEELASLVMGNATRRRRRMNPGNAHALRRAHRRLDSFHRLCMHNDVLRGRRRSSGRGKSCGSSVIVAK
jgi:hypothetical protein